MVHLVDINILLARCDPAHLHHKEAAHWFAVHSSAGWASCPLTENGFVRILGNPRYPNSPGSPGTALQVLKGLIQALPNHTFFPDEVTLCDAFAFPDLRSVTSKQITDCYLLALAVNFQAKFLTFDRGIEATLIPGGREALVLL